MTYCNGGGTGVQNLIWLHISTTVSYPVLCPKVKNFTATNCHWQGFCTIKVFVSVWMYTFINTVKYALSYFFKLFSLCLAFFSDSENCQNTKWWLIIFFQELSYGAGLSLRLYAKKKCILAWDLQFPYKFHPTLIWRGVISYKIPWRRKW